MQFVRERPRRRHRAGHRHPIRADAGRPVGRHKCCANGHHEFLQPRRRFRDRHGTPGWQCGGLPRLRNHPQRPVGRIAPVSGSPAIPDVLGGIHHQHAVALDVHFRGVLVISSVGQRRTANRGVDAADDAATFKHKLRASLHHHVCGEDVRTGTRRERAARAHRDVSEAGERDSVGKPQHAALRDKIAFCRLGCLVRQRKRAGGILRIPLKPRRIVEASTEREAARSDEPYLRRRCGQEPLLGRLLLVAADGRNLLVVPAQVQPHVVDVPPPDAASADGIRILHPAVDGQPPALGERVAGGHQVHM